MNAALRLLVFLFVASSAAFEFASVTEQIPESNPVTRLIVTDGQTRCSFIPPRGWELGADKAAKKIILQPFSGGHWFTISLSTNAPAPTSARLRAIVSERFDSVKIVEDFEASSGSGPGNGVVFFHTFAGKVTVESRLAHFGSPAGSFELSLTSPPQGFDSHHPIWTGLLNSFRIEKAPPK